MKPPPLLDNQVHVVTSRLDELPPVSPEACLSADELVRAARWQRPQDRDRFICGRAWLRRTLAAYLGMAPASLTFELGAHGKPALPPPHHGLQFNLSHSDDVALLAVSRAGRVGVDVEAVRPMADMAAIARRHFAPAEWQRWSALTADQRVPGFYDCWTRKEAYVKAVGAGLLAPLDSFEVAFEPHRPPALLSVDGSVREAAQWNMWTLEPAPGYRAAVIVRGTGLELLRVDHG